MPNNAYIARIRASQHETNTVYLAAENHQNGDFAPYLFKSTDTGYTWTSISGDLPARGSTYAIAEDHVDPRLLFVGTEFGAYWSKDGGQHWMKIAGLPTIAVREIAIQKRENDLVLGTFGRGVYIVDDYSAVRATTAETMTAAATLYPVRDAWMYVPTRAVRDAGSGVPGRDVLHRTEPTVWCGLHVSPQGRHQDAEAEADRRREGGRKGRPDVAISDAGTTARRSGGRSAGDSVHDQ